MTWNQVYNPLNNLGLSALVAAIPLFILLYMLGVRRTKGHYAALVGTFAALLLAIIVWGMPVSLAVSATLERYGLRDLSLSSISSLRPSGFTT